VSVLAHAPAPGVAGPPPEPAAARPRARWVPYVLLAPGLVWLSLFFILPTITLVSTSLQTGSLATGYSQTFEIGNYTSAWSAYYPQLIRSFLYAGAATLAALAIAYPLAYTIAFKAGRYRNVLLVLVVAPFYTSFLLRTLAWKTILADNGIIVQTMERLGILDLLSLVGLTADDRVLATPLAVITGLTYNFLPFMTLPLYASLERLDPRLVEAAGDLYASPFTAFRKVTFRCRCPASSPARCSPSSPPPVTTSTPACWAACRRRP
jgi:spermidine/putrescine transport system permease protein